MTDTVGFIRKLPPTIITAFRATLEEVGEADLLIHVVDMTSHNAPEQTQTVESILTDLHLQDKTRITALNKVDTLLDKGKSWDEESAIKYLTELNITNQTIMSENTVFISASKKWGLTKLLELIGRILPRKKMEYGFSYPTPENDP